MGAKGKLTMTLSAGIVSTAPAANFQWACGFLDAEQSCQGMLQITSAQVQVANDEKS